MEANDMKAMREAVIEIRDKILSGGYERVTPAEIVNICDAALAKPPRNCDFGTAGEQAERCLAQFDQWRRKGDNRTLMAAIMEWTQAPYEGEAARD